MLLIRAFFMVMTLRLLLWFVPLVSLQKLLLAIRPRAHHGTPGRVLPARIAWAVTTAGCFIPKSTCLVKAMAVQALLAGEGIASVLHIGVMKGNGASLDAHAWVESEGRVVIGGSEDLPYKKIASFSCDMK